MHNQGGYQVIPTSNNVKCQLTKMDTTHHYGIFYRERERERENPMLVSIWVKGQGILDDTQINKPKKFACGITISNSSPQTMWVVGLLRPKLLGSLSKCWAACKYFNLVLTIFLI